MCTTDGTSGSIETPWAGCGDHDNSGYRWCYVLDPTACPGAFESTLYDTAGWVRCGEPPAPPSLPTPPNLSHLGIMCTNTCTMYGLVSDSECDDGGAGADYDLCALGTDCADCGVRTVGGTSSSGGGSASGGASTSGSGSTSGTDDTGLGSTSGSGGTSGDTGFWPSTCEDWDPWAPPTGTGSCADYESDPSRCSEDWSDVVPSFWPRPWEACCACGGGYTPS